MLAPTVFQRAEGEGHSPEAPGRARTPPIPWPVVTGTLEARSFQDKLGPRVAERFGKYDLETRLGVGGMAEVWLARTEGPAGFSKRVVIKRILPSLVNDPEFVEMFLREARLAALLNHPNVVQIFDLGQAEHTYFLVMEYIEGRSLRYLHKQTLALGKHLEVGFVASVLAGACAGLHHAHELRGPTGEPLALVHRDVSPDNLLVSYEGMTKIIDFGIAKAFSDTSGTNSGVVKGKYGYMSPELVRGEPVDRRSDVYAMGVVLFEALSGERPYLGAPSEVLKAILQEPVPSMSSFREGLPSDIVHLTEAMLSKQPRDRPQTIREVELTLAENRPPRGLGDGRGGQGRPNSGGGSGSAFALTLLSATVADDPSGAENPLRSLATGVSTSAQTGGGSVGAGAGERDRAGEGDLERLPLGHHRYGRALAGAVAGRRKHRHGRSRDHQPDHPRAYLSSAEPGAAG